MKKYLLVGSDPECFLRDSSGRLVSALGVIPGTKENPSKTQHGSIQVDNILAEFNSRPSASLLEFIENHRLIISDLESVIKPLDLHLDFVASALADDSLLSDPSTRLAGCDPDFSVWTLSANEPADYSLTNIRGAGGHLHISFNQAEEEGDDARIKMVKALDLMLGVPSVILDKDTDRRKYYGKAGSFRPKGVDIGDPYYGIEYRTLSNFWLKSENLMAWAWSGVENVYNNLQSLSDLADNYRDSIISIIDNGDSESAISLCKEVGVVYAV
jgi:hypothetical protein